MTVYLVGVGPGSIDLLTLKAKELLETTQCALVDMLASDDIVSMINPFAEVIDVGKSPNHHSLSQDEINDLMLAKAREYESVIRIKGGDPFLFGRGGEEQHFLTSHGVDCEIVPGISSSFAAPTYAGIPITHRDVAPLVTIVTGHEKDENSQVDWLALGKSNSPLVILMGVENRALIAKKLMEGGRPPLEPVAVVTNATRENQQVKITFLENLGKLEIVSPSIIIVGEIVEKQVPWFEPKVLSGCKVAVVRPEGRTSSLGQMLRNAGATVLEVPASVCHTIFSPLPEFNQDAILFTSSQGVDSFLENLKKHNLDWRVLADKKVFAIGSSTKKYIEDKGCNVDGIALTSDSSGCIDLVRKNNISSVLLVRPEKTRELIANELGILGVHVTEYVVYKTVPKEINDVISSRIKGCNFVVVAATSTVEALSSIGKFSCITIGPVTTKSAREHGWNVLGQASQTTLEGLFNSVLDAWGK